MVEENEFVGGETKLSCVCDGIELEGVGGETQLSHSYIAQAVTHNEVEADLNTDYLDMLRQQNLENLDEQFYIKISKLFSVVSMNYQICNGGISQYFDNGYDNYREADSPQDTIRFDKNKQVDMLEELIEFAHKTYPVGTFDLDGLKRCVECFDEAYDGSYDTHIDFKDNEGEWDWWDDTKHVIHVDYVDEDGNRVACKEYDELGSNFDCADLDELHEYQDLFLEMDDTFEAAVNGFDDMYYRYNDMLEMVIEDYAQYLVKSIERAEDFKILETLTPAERNDVTGYMKSLIAKRSEEVEQSGVNRAGEKQDQER